MTQRSRGPLPSAPKMPKKNSASTISDSTESTSGPLSKITNSVRNASRAVNRSAAPATSVRIGLEPRVGELLPALALIGEQLDREQPEREAADVGEVGDAAARPGRVEVEVAEEQLLHEPEPEDDQGRQLEDREEEHDEDDRDNAGAREQQEVAAQHARDRPGRADVGDGGVRVHEHLQQRRGQASEQVEDHELDPAHRVFDVVAEDPQEQHVPAEVE